MKMTSIVCVVFCAVLLVPTMIMPAAKASINNYNWIGMTVRNEYDSFYGVQVTGYEENTSAILVVSVSNDLFIPDQLNVSSVKVGFDWGINYSSTECSITNPYPLANFQSHVFTVTFTVPSVLLASNMVTHRYTIYVENVNSTAGDKHITNTWDQDGSGFVVFSADQAAAKQYKQQLDAYPTNNFNGIPFLTANARQLLQQSNLAETLASSSYARGDFSQAKSHYSTSLTYVEEAWSNETSKWSTFEDAIANLIQGGGTLLTMQGYAWLIFAIGFLIMSFGVLIYLARRRIPPPPQPKQP